jgi:HSP20 family protein
MTNEQKRRCLVARQENEGRNLESWRPFSGLTRWERDFEKMFDDFFRFRSPSRRGSALAVDTDVYEEGDDIVVKAELPGMSKEDLSISIQDHLLTLKGEKKTEDEIKQQDYYRLERSYGAFTRVVELPQQVQVDKCKASLVNGVLEIRLPKTEEAKKKQIAVKID